MQFIFDFRFFFLYLRLDSSIEYKFYDNLDNFVYAYIKMR